jgi:hypothetical protein
MSQHFMTNENTSYWEKIATRQRADLERRDERATEEKRLEHRIPNGKLNLQQRIAIANGLPLPTSEKEVKHIHDKKMSNVKHKKR